MKNILIIKIGAIGDIIMALPTLSIIKQNHPNCKVTWVCGAIVEPILKCIPDVDHIISIDEKKIFSKNKVSVLKALINYYQTVGLERFDLVLNFHHDARYSALHRLVRKDKLQVLNRNGDRPKLIPARSRSFEHLRLYKDFDHEYDGYLKFPRYNLPEFNIEAFIKINPGQKLITLAPGGANNMLNEQALRRWPINNYREIIKYFNSVGIIVCVTGAPSDGWVTDELKDLTYINLIGKLSLVQLISLFKKSDIVLTHDSGPFHLAIFAEKPKVIGLFGPTNPREFNYKLRNNNVNVIWGGKDLQCAPCYFGKNFSLGCTNNICMQQIAPKMVIDEIERLIEVI